MKYIHPLTHRKTSVSLPAHSYRRMCAARRIFARNGIFYSEQEIYRLLLKLFLKNWRGSGRKSNGLRRYNAAGKSYQIHPLYINQVLYAVLWQRAFHSGESVSRMLDVAIRVYLPRLIEELLRVPHPATSRPLNAHYWAARYAKRTRKYSDFFINYRCKTQHNRPDDLEYSQKTEIIYKIGLSPMQIWDLMHSAA
jgi:hypothetical protein